MPPMAACVKCDGTEDNMLQYQQCKLEYTKDSKEELIKKTARQLRMHPEEISNFKILHKSLDARKKPELYYTYTVAFSCQDEEMVLRRNRRNKNLSEFLPPPDLQEFVKDVKQTAGKEEKIVIVGSGPAGLMCAYFLALCGRKPVVIERGGSMWERVEKVSRFWDEGVLDTETNVSFGEGGAGTFSDGKLNTGVKDKTGKKTFILDAFIRHGAPEKIGYLSKPHIGTDELRDVILSMRETITELDGTYRFHTRLTGIIEKTSVEEEGTVRRLAGIRVCDEKGNEEEILCDKCILAIGHSARDTFEWLRDAGIPMEQKPFAVGVRVEHPQKKINESQYGTDDGRLPAADYKLTGKTSDGRGVYSFCMCPGGYVVNASTEEGGTVVNGMSNHARDSVHANSAIIVTVGEKDFGSSDELAGVAFQRELERRTFEVAHGKIPVQTLGDFETGRTSVSLGGNLPSTKGGYVPANVKKILPSFVADGIMEGMRQFGRKIKGFDDEDTLILGTETRTSSPVRIVRDASLESEGMKGLYPCGEGAGYAGGIMSAAMDGLRVAIQIVSERN